MKENILVITFDMIPYAANWGSCQRVFFLSDLLQKKGFNVFVIHYKGEFYGMFEKEISFFPIPIEIKYLAKLRRPICANSSSSSEVPNDSLKNIFRKCFVLAEKFIYNELNPFQAILGRLLLKEAKSDITATIKSHDISKVIISGPPFSLFSAVKDIKKNFSDIRIVLDYRDPWNLWNQGNPISTRTERTNLHLADRVVFVNERLRDDMIKQFGLDKDKCSIVSNGYSEWDWTDIIKGNTSHNSKKDRLIISYIGSYSFEKGGYTDFSCFLSAFAKFKYIDSVLVRFIGGDLSNEANKLKDKFKNSIEFVPRVAYKRSLEYMLDSDVLLLVYTGKESSKYVMTGKFFDYARSGNVIFGIADKVDTYFLDLIKKYNLGIASLNTEDSILDALNRVHRKWCEGMLHDLRNTSNYDLKEFSREYQNQKYIDIIKDL